MWMRGIASVGVVVLLLISGGMALGQDAAKAGFKFAAEVPLLECEGTPCIEATAGEGKSLRLSIDTGNVNSVLNSKVAQSLGLKPTERQESGAPEGMFQTVVPALRIGALKLQNLAVLSADLSEMIRAKEMPRVDGILAYTAFQDRVLQLDFAAHVLRISEPQPTGSCRGRCDKISLITFGKEGPPIVVAQGFELNGEKVSAQVDTMFTGSMLIYNASVEKLSLKGAAQSKDVRFFPLTDGGVNMKEAEAQKEGFGDLTLSGEKPRVYFPTENVHEPDGLFDATVGMELFSGVVLTLDFHDMTIGIEKANKTPR
jgi:predicted aspartyl protease